MRMLVSIGISAVMLSRPNYQQHSTPTSCYFKQNHVVLHSHHHHLTLSTKVTIRCNLSLSLFSCPQICHFSDSKHLFSHGLIFRIMPPFNHVLLPSFSSDAPVTGCQTQGHPYNELVKYDRRLESTLFQCVRVLILNAPRPPVSHCQLTNCDILINLNVCLLSASLSRTLSHSLFLLFLSFCGMQ